MKIKTIQTGLIVVAVGLSMIACEKKVKLETDIERGSYALGQQIGNNLKNQQIDFDAHTLAASLKDVSEGKESRLKPEEIQASLMKLQEVVAQKQQASAETTLAEGKAFLEKNKTAEGVKVTASGLQYIMEKEGTGKTPALKDTVVAHYKGTLTNGQTFDSSYDRGQPAEFPVGGVIKGWTEALQMMKVGSKVKLFIPPDLAYGNVPRPGIPANSVLVFDVELINVK